MYSLEGDLRDLESYIWDEWEEESGDFWREICAFDWESAYNKDPMASIALKEKLKSYLN